MTTYRASILQNIGKTTEVYHVAVSSCFIWLTPSHHYYVGCSSIYLSVWSLLEYTVQLCISHSLQSGVQCTCVWRLEYFYETMYSGCDVGTHYESLYVQVHTLACMALGIPNPALQESDTHIFYYTSTIAWLERGLQVLQHRGDLMLLVAMRHFWEVQSFSQDYPYHLSHLISDIHSPQLFGG